MALVTEVLQFLVDVDTGKAVSSFDKLGNSSQKAMDKMRSIGDIALEGFRKGAQAIDSTVTAASNLNEAIDFSNRIFGTAADSIENWAKTAYKSVGLSQTAAITGAATFGAFGRQIGKTGEDLAGFSEDLVALASDMASVRNTSPEDAIRALAAAFRGQYKPILQYGVALNETTIKQQALAMGIYDGSGKLDAQQKIVATSALLFDKLSYAQGDFLATSDQLANQQRILKAEFQNVEAAIGKGLLPTFRTLTGAAQHALDAFLGLPQPIQETVGHLLAFTTVGLGAVAATIKMASAFTKFSEATGLGVKASAQLNASLGGLVTGIGAVTAVIAGVDIGMTAMNSIMHTTSKQTQALNGVLNSLQGSSEDISVAFADMARQQDKAFKVSHLWTDFGDRIQLAGDTGSRTIADLNAAFDELAQKSPAAAHAVIEALRDQNAQLDHGSKQYRENAAQIDKWSKQLYDGERAQKAAAQAADDFNKNIDATAEDMQVKAIPTAKELAQSLDNLKFSIVGADRSTKVFADAIDTMDMSKPADAASDFVKSIGDVTDAVDKAKKSGEKYTPVLDDMGILTKKQTAAQMDVRKALDDSGSKAAEYVKTLVAQGQSTEIVNAQTETLRTKLYLAAKQAGLTDQQAGALIATYGLMPKQIETAVKLQGDADAKFRVQVLLGLYDDIPDELRTEIGADIAAGDLAAADKALTSFVSQQSKKTVKINVQYGSLPGSPGAPGYGTGPRSLPPTGGTTPPPMPTPRASNTNVVVNISARQTASQAYAEARKFARRNGGRVA